MTVRASCDCDVVPTASYQKLLVWDESTMQSSCIPGITVQRIQSNDHDATEPIV